MNGELCQLVELHQSVQVLRYQNKTRMGVHEYKRERWAPCARGGTYESACRRKGDVELSGKNRNRGLLLKCRTEYSQSTKVHWGTRSPFCSIFSLTRVLEPGSSLVLPQTS